MNSQDQLLLLITRLTYSAEGMTPALRLFFSRFLEFHFRGRISISRFRDIENRFSFNPLTGEEEISAAATGLTTGQLALCLAAIQLLCEEASRKNERVFARQLKSKIDHLKIVFGLQAESGQIEAQKKSIQEQYNKFTSRVTIRIQTSLLPLTMDYLVRWVILLGAGYAEWDFELTKSVTFSIPMAVLVAAYLILRQQRRVISKLLDEHGGADKFHLLHQVTPGQYTWLAFYFASTVFVGYLTGANALALEFGLSVGILYLSYFLFFRVGNYSKNNLIQQLESDLKPKREFSNDDNDEEIVSLETRLNASTGRLDAYVLESALFGALSFSGFLQILSANLVSMNDLEIFTSSLMELCKSFIGTDMPGISKALYELQDKKSLFCMVSIESLACSMLFIAVIAARLRFSNIADRVRTAINLARAFNEKEERLLSETQNNSASLRQQVITNRINDYLQEASSVLAEVKPVMEYMEYFRNSGIALFLLILVTSSLFITSTLGLLMTLLIPATYVYFNRARLQELMAAFVLDLRIRFNRNSRLLLALALVPILIAITLRMFTTLKVVPILFATGYLFIGIYLCAWLVVASHLDEQFGEVEIDPTRLRKWNTVKNLLGVMVLVFMTGNALKEIQMSPANLLLMVGSLSIALLMYFTGYYLSKVRWLGVVCGWLVAINSVTFLFKTLNLPGSQVMRLTSIISVLMLLLLVMWKRKMFHQLLIRIILTAFLLNVAYNVVYEIARL